MRIVTCPKGGRVPEKYCRKSCLNYPGTSETKKRTTPVDRKEVDKSKRSP